MTIIYTSKIEKLIGDERNLQRNFDKKTSTTIKAVLSILAYASSLEDVPNIPPTRRHKLNGMINDTWAIDVSKNYRMLVESNINGLAPSEIFEIKIIDICDYH